MNICGSYSCHFKFIEGSLQPKRGERCQCPNIYRPDRIDLVLLFSAAVKGGYQVPLHYAQPRPSLWHLPADVAALLGGGAKQQCFTTLAIWTIQSSTASVEINSLKVIFMYFGDHCNCFLQDGFGRTAEIELV